MSLPLPELPAENERGVFVYMSAANRFLGSVLDALRARRIPVLAYVAGNIAANVTDLVQASNIRYLHTLVDLRQVAATCRLAITHGGCQSASLLLRYGTKLLICPQDLEKVVFAARLQDRNLAYSLNWFTPNVKDIGTAIDGILDSNELPCGLEAFVASYAGRPAGDNVRNIVEFCENLSVQGTHG